MPLPKIVLITGCSSGIGLSAAKALHQRGYRVFATVRNSQAQQDLQRHGITSLWMDLNDTASIHRAVEEFARQTDGCIDALINNAGFGQPGAVEDISRAVLRMQFETNVFGLQELTNLIIPMMRKQGYGRIINVSSILGLVTMAFRGVYCASKYAVEALSDALRLELHGSGIKVSLIVPGPIESHFRDAARRSYDQNIIAQKSVHEAQYAQMLNNIEQLKANSAFTNQPEAVVKKMIMALESPHPKIRYYVTFPAYLLSALKRILPARLMDALMWQLCKSEIKDRASQ